VNPQLDTNESSNKRKRATLAVKPIRNKKKQKAENEPVVNPSESQFLPQAQEDSPDEDNVSGM
jgi:hypothetical protein